MVSESHNASVVLTVEWKSQNVKFTGIDEALYAQKSNELRALNNRRANKCINFVYHCGKFADKKLQQLSLDYATQTLILLTPNLTAFVY